VEGAGAAVDELLDEGGDIGAGSPLSREGANLGLRGDLASQEEPEETLREGLLTTRSLGEELLEVGDLYKEGELARLIDLRNWRKESERTVWPRKRIPSSESRTEP
jgi:hypothetical protein